MPPVEQFVVSLPPREKLEIYLVELPDGRVVARTAAELAHAPDEVRIAAGLLPRGGAGA